MPRLTAAQLATLKSHLAANTATVVVGGTVFPINSEDVLPAGAPPSDEAAQKVADWYNLAATPAFKVYRGSVPMSEIMLNGFDWTRVDNLSVGKARIWDWMFNADPAGHTIDPSKPNVRAGINATWVGTAADLAVRAAVYQHCVRDALVGEKLLASGTGAAPDASGVGPATAGVGTDGKPVGVLTPQDIKDAWASN